MLHLESGGKAGSAAFTFLTQAVASLLQCGISEAGWVQTESFRLERTYEFIKPSINPALPRPPLTLIPKCHTYMSSKSLQGWWLHHFLEQCIQGLTTLLVKKFFLMSKINLPWCHLKLFPLVTLLISCEKTTIPQMSAPDPSPALMLCFEWVQSLTVFPVVTGPNLKPFPPSPCPSLKACRTSCWFMVIHHSKLHQHSWDKLHRRGRTSQNGSRKGTNFWSNCCGTSHPSFLLSSSFLSLVSAGNML